jgi:hypothetical protein
LRQLKPEHARVKAQRPFEVSYFQMNMAYANFRMDRVSVHMRAMIRPAGSANPVCPEAAGADGTSGNHSSNAQHLRLKHLHTGKTSIPPRPQAFSILSAQQKTLARFWADSGI